MASTLIDDEITTQDLRAKVGEVFSRVQYSRKPLVVTKQGKEVGVIVSAEWLDDIRRLEQQRARREALKVLSEAAKEGGHSDESDDDVAELARSLLEEARAAKSKPRKRRSK
jgi:prevent-host-death family protein